MSRGRPEPVEGAERVDLTPTEPGGSTADSAQRQRILNERARALSREARVAVRSTALPLVSMASRDESWAVDARLVWDTFEIVEFTPLPGARPPLAGITGWRGSVLTVLDLRSLLGMPAPPLADLRYAIVVGEERPEFGILADTLGELIELENGDVREPPEGVAPQRTYVQGVTAEALVVLDVRRLIRDHR